MLPSAVHGVVEIPGLFPIGLALFLVEGVEKHYWQPFTAKQSPTSYLTLGKAVATT